MFGAEIAVQPHLVGSLPVVPVEGASALVVFRDCLRLGDLNDHLVQRCPARLVQLAKVLALDLYKLISKICIFEVTARPPL